MTTRRPTQTTTPPTTTPTTTCRTPTTTRRTPERAGAAGEAYALARCVGDVDSFLAQRWERQHLLHQGCGFDDLLSLSDVDTVLTGHGLRRPAVRLVRDGEVIDPALWTRRARTGAASIDDLVDPARLVDLHAAGATVALQSLQRWWPPLTLFCRDLEAQLGHAVQANAYLTPPGATGLSPHHDTHDVFVLQVQGTKRWTLRAPVVELPLASQRSKHVAAAGQPVLAEIELTPGAALYLPRGMVHSATAQRGSSLHLTVGVLAGTVVQALRALVDRAATERVGLRRALPPVADSDAGAAAATAAALAEGIEELVSWLRELDAAQAAASWRAERFRRRPILHGRLAELARLEELDDSALLAPREACATVALVGERVEVRLADRTIDLPGALAPAVDRLLGQGAVRVGDLADLLDGPSRLVLARRLVREGLLRTVDG